ncbi:hypothetical protein Avbf_01112 [Armadillidium vulgare]|nr:hypothetical protein Avbf_01112 [Armadillidium vulgare]
MEDLNDFTTFFPEENEGFSSNGATETILMDFEPDPGLILEADNATKSNIFKNLKKFAKEIADEIKNDPNHGYLLLSLVIAMIWAIYIILYNSRVLGHILTVVLRKFIKKGDIKIGSISISLLWGKLMFRDIVYVTEDYSFRVVDAIVQFHYWVPYMKKELHEDMSKSDHRLWVELNGPELHVYNRSEVYSKLEELFGLDPQMIPKSSKADIESLSNKDIPVSGEDKPLKDMSFWSSWRDLIPVIKVDLNYARFVFGNHLVPSTLLFTMDKAECVYSTKPPACSLDFFMHVVKAKSENFRVILAPSPKYTGILDEPPRFMGEGFVVMSSSKILFYYYMDEAGFVPGNNPDYQKMVVTKKGKPGSLRFAHQFDVRLTILTEATIDILFSKETNAVHMTVQKGSYYEMTIPWIVKKDGYCIRILGQFLYLDASTSLQYRNLIEAESFKYEVNVKYPLIWNRHQSWDLQFHGSKVSYHFLYAHKHFFHDLIDDWSSKSHPDILHFLPYTWYFTFAFKQFEFITLANEYNWIDCSSQHLANGLEKTLYLSLFLPVTNTTSNIIGALDKNAKLQGDYQSSFFLGSSWRKLCKLSAGWVDCWQVPEIELTLGYTYHPMPPMGPSPQANVSTPEKMEILLSPIRAPNKKKQTHESSKINTPENFDPMSLAADTFKVELLIIQPSDIKLYGSILRHFIHLKENIFGEDQRFIDMSEPSPYEKVDSLIDQEISKNSSSGEKDEFDGRRFRPFEVTVYIDIRNVQGHLMKDCTGNEPLCPTIVMDRLVFEMNKRYQETQMQVLLSPIILTTEDKTTRSQPHTHLNQGFIVLSGLQMRGHAMFSDTGLSLSDETVEYSWLVELTIGSLTGKLTAPQLQHFITGLETFLFTAVDNENCMRHPRPYNLCYHGEPQPECTHTLPDHFCPSIDAIKYKMLRVSVDAIDFHLVEAGTDLNLQIFPIRIATCNLHGQHTRNGITAHIKNIRLRNFICGGGGTGGTNSTRHFSNDTELNTKAFEETSVGGLSAVGAGESVGTTGTTNTAGTSSMPVNNTGNPWVEAGALILGPLYIDAAVSSNIVHHNMQQTQHKFLKLHDQKTKRLWFLWPKEATKVNQEISGKCGCVGGCSFFGLNRNGLRFFKPSKQDFIEGLNVATFRVNEPGLCPGYGQSILHPEKSVFDLFAYSGLTKCYYGSAAVAERDQPILSSGYTKNASPAGVFPCDLKDNKDLSVSGSSLHRNHDISNDHYHPSHKSSQVQHRSDSKFHEISSLEIRSRAKYSINGIRGNRVGESNSLGRTTSKDQSSSLCVPSGDLHTSPGSLSDLRLSADNVHSASHIKMPSSLSLQTELPLSKEKSKNSVIAVMEQENEEHLSNNSSESPPDPLGIFHRTVSVGSEALSEAFFSADEDQPQIFSRRGTSASPSSSQISLPTVPECELSKKTSEDFKSKSLNASQSVGSHPDTDWKNSTPTPKGSRSNSSGSLTGGRSTTSSNSSLASSSSTCDYRKGSHGHSQTSLLHSSESDVSILDEVNPQPKIKLKKRSKTKVSANIRDDFFSEGGSVSSNSFISAMSSHEDIALVDLHMQLNKPITESPLLMSSYINHMTQLHCSNWDTSPPSFEKENVSTTHTQPRRYVPVFEKISEGFTAIRMVEGARYCPPPRSPPPLSSNTPSHPYSWDTPIFTWGEGVDTAQEDTEEPGSAILDSNTTRTTVVMKLKRDIDITVSPIALESTQRFLEALTPVMESLHPLTIVNSAHFKSVSKIVGKNTLKKDRYMYWSRIRDGKKCGTPDQTPVVSSTYQESCFQQIQGQIRIPRVNLTLLQASVVEEIISFSALDNIRDLTCVSLFSLCLDGVNVQFSSGHQSKQSVQIFMRNPKISGKPKKSFITKYMLQTKLKIKQNVDLFSEPVYIETSEKQQEENRISVSVNKLHIQLRRLKNESSLLKDAIITAIPNHRSKVMFTFRRYNMSFDEFEEDIEDPTNSHPLITSANGGSALEEERMGFIMFEAGLENICIKAIKRRGFGDHTDGNGKGRESCVGGREASSHSRRESTAPGASSGGSGGPASGHNKGATRTASAPTGGMGQKTMKNSSGGTEHLPNEVPAPTTAPAGISTPFYVRKATPEGKDLNETLHSTSPSQASNITGHSASTKNSIREENQMHCQGKSDKRDISSFIIELSTVWFNFAAPPHTPITRKIDFTRLDWNFLSTASPSITAWMNPSDRLTVAVIHFLHVSESRRLGVIASLMAEALDNKYSKLIPLSQTIQEDPSCQLCNVLKRYILQTPLQNIESNLNLEFLPKLATLRQGIVVLSRQWKSALYMPLLMEQSFKHKQSHPVHIRRPSHSDHVNSRTRNENSSKNVEEKASLVQSGKESPLSDIDEEIKDGVIGSLGEVTDGVISSSSSQLPPKQPLPSFAPRSSTASAILPIHHRNSHESPVKKFHFPNFGNVFEETINFFKNSSHHHHAENFSPKLQNDSHVESSDKSHPVAFPLPVFGLKSGSKGSGAEESEKQSLMSATDEDTFESHLPKEDFYKWMARQQEHNQHANQVNKHTVTFNQGLDLPVLSEGSEVDFEDTNEPNSNAFHSQKQPTTIYLEPQSAHFLEAHVIFEPLLSAIGVIAQQVTAGALEQLGANVSVGGSIETFRMDIIESEASKLSRKKRRTGLHPGNNLDEDFGGKFYLDIGSEVPSFICEKMGLDIDIRKVPDESRSWVCQQPTLFVSRSALKQHTSTMVNFSLSVSYIAQQVNMPLLRLLHQITSMYQNARDTQIGLKEQRPSKTKNSVSHPVHKDSFSELHESEYKGVENSLSLSEEQATLSSVGGFRGQRDSVVSSLSARPISPTPTTQAQPQSSINRFGRPQSFAQKFKSSKKMGRGYKNLVVEKEKGASSPLLSRSVSGLEPAPLFSDKSPLLGTTEPLPTTPPAVPSTPKCWRNIYYLVDLYATTPETKTVQQRPSVAQELSERYKTSQKFDNLKDRKNDDVEAGLTSSTPQETSILTDRVKDSGYFWSERTPLVIFGYAKIQKTKLLATISGLKLEAEMNAMNSSITFREKVKGGTHRSTSEMSLIAHVGSTMIVLLEGIAPNQQTVVRVTINKSQGLYSSLSRKPKNKNSALITIGPIQIDIPQHPIILHDMMTRGTKQLSSTLQELRVTRPSRLSRGTTIDETDAAPSPRPSQSKTPEPMEALSAQDSLLHPLTIQFSILLQEMSIHAALLPSLQATYCMQQVSSDGFTGAKANFKIHLSYHHLAFTTKIQDLPIDSNLPPSAKISLPQVHVEAQYIHDDASTKEINLAADGMVLTEGNYLSAVAEIGSLEHSLTTDLLNHLVFVQKVFMKEVNEVVQKMAGSDKPVSLFAEEVGGTFGGSHSSRPQSLLLFNIQIRLKGIIITATTPTQSAVRLETGTVELQLSNRVENVSKPPRNSASSSHHSKIFGKAELIRNDLFDEIEPHFQQLAYFRTRIGLRNALHEELSSVSEEGEMVLINLTRPLICIQPLAVDRAVLVWLNYKNAYEYWNEQRATLNKEVLTATQQVFEKVPQFSSLSSANIKSTLFLKLTVSDIGICLPLNPCRTISHQVDSTETRDALVVTLGSTIISACNSGSLVCKAQFKDFCTRFAPEFETSLDDWKPDYRDRSIMNLCKVSEGTYEVCSRTLSQNTDKGDNAKWLLNVEWQMEGVELHFDVNIGKHLSSLARTLTMLTGSPDVANAPSSSDYDSDEDDYVDHTPQGSGNLPAFIFDTHMDPKQRAKLLEIEMNEQAKTVNDLKTLGASPLTIEQEVRRLKELEQIVSNDFRRDMLMKIRRQSIKATSMKDRLGLGQKLQMRSKSFRIPSPTVEVKEPTRHWSIATGSTDSNTHLDDVDISEVFVPSPTDQMLPPLSRTHSPTPVVNTSLETEYEGKADDIDSREINVKINDKVKFEGITSDSFKKKVFSSQSSYGISHQGTQSSSNASQLFVKPQDPSIDLVLDVKVCIKSGECLLYNEDFSKKKDKEEEPKGKMKKERSYSGGLYDLSLSPNSFRKKVDLKNYTATKLKHLNQAIPSAGVVINGFVIPGLDVEVHYESHNIHGDTPLSVGKGIPTDAGLSWPSQERENTSLRGSTVSSTGKNSPTQSLNTPSKSPSVDFSKPSTFPENYEDQTETNKPAGLPPLFQSSGTQRRGYTKRASLFTWLTLQTIPEETVISPSILEFMEKVLEPIPFPEPTKNGITSPLSTEPEMVYSEDIESSLSGGPSSAAYPYASFPVDVIVYFHMKPSTIRFSSQPVLRVECLLKLPSLNVVFSSKRAEESDIPGTISDASAMGGLMGGLNVTGALEDFSLYVFHPYGSKNTSSSTIPCNPLNESERKDFLSVVVEFVKFHISRSRKINFIKQETQNKSFKSPQQTDSSKAIVRFSTIIDIGAALFKYDMRHITEILAFSEGLV